MIIAKTEDIVSTNKDIVAKNNKIIKLLKLMTQEEIIIFISHFCEGIKLRCPPKIS
jgi:hypothetical protein